VGSRAAGSSRSPSTSGAERKARPWRPPDAVAARGISSGPTDRARCRYGSGRRRIGALLTKGSQCRPGFGSSLSSSSCWPSLATLAGDASPGSGAKRPPKAMWDSDPTDDEHSSPVRSVYALGVKNPTTVTKVPDGVVYVQVTSEDGSNPRMPRSSVSSTPPGPSGRRSITICW
jgi:hypothetical protein